MNRISCFVFLCALALLVSACGDDTKSNEDTMGGDTDMVSDGGDTGDGVSDADMVPDMPKVCDAPSGLRPGIRSEHASAFSTGSNQVVIHGGSKSVSMACNIPPPTYEADTFVYDVDCDDWVELPVAGGPVGRTRHAMVYDSTEHRMIIHGGRTSSATLNDTWALDMESLTWSRLMTTNPPDDRMMHMMTYDPVNHRIIMFGGNTTSDLFGQGYAPLGDLWVLDLETNAWLEITAAGGPEARLAGGAVWDATRNRMVVFGGQTSFSNYFGDIWALEVNDLTPSWTELNPGGGAGSPSVRFWAPLVHDTINDKYIVFGGHDLSELAERNDIHAFNPATNGWSIDVSGDTFMTAIQDVCAPPADFAAIVDGLPERRQAHSMVGGPDAMFIYGGKTDCGVVDDLVKYDFTAQTFSDLTPASVGEVCIRAGGVGCTSLCN